MPSVDQQVYPQRDDEEGGTDLDLALPFGKEQQGRERKQDRRHRHEVTARKRQKRLEQAAAVAIHHGPPTPRGASPCRD